MIDVMDMVEILTTFINLLIRQDPIKMEVVDILVVSPPSPPLFFLHNTEEAVPRFSK